MGDSIAMGGTQVLAKNGPLNLWDWLKTGKGQMIMASWTVCFWGVTGYSVNDRLKRRQGQAKKVRGKLDGGETTDVEKKQVPGEESAPVETKPESALKAMLKIILPKNRSVKLRGLLLAAAIVLRLWVSIKVSRQIGLMGSLLSQRKWRQLAHAQMSYALWTIPASLLNAFVDFASSYFASSIRDRLAQEVHMGYGEKSMLTKVTQALLDPSQRATSDCDKLAEDMGTMFQSLFKPCAETLILSVTLAKMMGTRQLLMCYAYFALAGTWSRSVTPSMTTLSKKVQSEEGQFRQSYARVHEYAEEVVFNGGEAVEAKVLSEQYRSLSNVKVAFNFQKFWSAALDGYVVRYMGILTALSMMTPALSKLSRREKVKDPTEFFLTCLHLLVNLMTAFKDVALAFRTLGSVRGLSDRVLKLLGILKTSNKNNGKRIETEDRNDVIILRDVDIETPASPTCAPKTLFKSFNLHIKAGESIFVEGPNGIGKSSLFRVLNGIWEPTNGTIQMPTYDHVMFLTQRPYLVHGLTLRDQVSYPHYYDNDAVRDKEMIHALHLVGLLPKQNTDISILDQSWRIDGLSAGEMQRLACARLLFRKPVFAFLDECTSSCTEDFEQHFIKTCIEDFSITLVTISHRQTAKNLHQRTLSLV